MSTETKFKAFLAKPKMLRCILALVFLPCCSYPQQSKLLIQPPEQLSVKRGETAEAKLNVTVLPNFHVNSDKPRDEFLIPLKLTWTDGPLQAQGTTYPKPEEITVGKDNLLVFTGKFVVTTKFTVPAHASTGPVVMTGKLRYQACNNQMCFRPSSADVRLPVSIE